MVLDLEQSESHPPHRLRPSTTATLKVYTSRIQVEILRIVFDAGRPLRPSQIIENLKTRGIELEAENRIFYHLMKLALLGFIVNDKKARDYSTYAITAKGRKFLLASASREDAIEFFSRAIAETLKIPPDQVRKTLTDLAPPPETNVAEGGK